ncbi:HIRAN domain-containing protein [Chlorogloeopsis fritschii PCC 9212]|uniref:Restriction endonuclease n=1 Tax=Chlorogloeopsis fritschii PCC 6912 TaxID=211165 RepID=A0A433NF52_CHLFR|nr:HIRAN domain-containing protein [Chlorogloeopsis fritschii]RUR80777.1 restriction endonuclease [Chlorogloeopsis fritschii PCC 6912]
MKTPKTLFLAWQDPNTRSWFPIGRLTFDGMSYQFVYTQGVKEAQQKCGFEPLSSFPELNKVYTSTQLFPVFSNRLMPRSRPDYSSFIQWLNIPEHEDDPIAMLARSGGQRETDTLTVFPRPEPDSDGRYHFHFFSHGLRHLPQCAIERINLFVPGEKLWLSHEFQNPYDSQALTLNTEDHYIVGYCPRYLRSEVFKLLWQDPSLVDLRVERVNRPPTPLQFRLLCNITAQCKDGFRPFSGQEYQPLIEEDMILETML